jgi:hypothetical protein
MGQQIGESHHARMCVFQSSLAALSVDQRERQELEAGQPVPAIVQLDANPWGRVYMLTLGYNQDLDEVLCVVRRVKPDRRKFLGRCRW